MERECPKCNGKGVIKIDPMVRHPQDGFHKLIERQIRGGLKSLRDAHPEYFPVPEYPGDDVLFSAAKRIAGNICSDHIREDLLRFLKEEDMLSAEDWRAAVNHINKAKELEDRRT
jgi:hypothetical protein